VEQFAALRDGLRQTEARMDVVKNSYLKWACAGLGRERLMAFVAGPCAIVTGGGEVTQAAKILSRFAKDNEGLAIKGGMLGETPLSAGDVQALTQIPPREILLGQVVGTIAAPMTRLVGVMSQKLLSLAYVLKAIEEKKGKV
jgi:large subunit ribosomal protein L10